MPELRRAGDDLELPLRCPLAMRKTQASPPRASDRAPRTLDYNQARAGTRGFCVIGPRGGYPRLNSVQRFVRARPQRRHLHWWVKASKRTLSYPRRGKGRCQTGRKACKSPEPTRRFEPRTPSLRVSTTDGSQSPQVPPGPIRSQNRGLRRTARSRRERRCVRLVFGRPGSETEGLWVKDMTHSDDELLRVRRAVRPAALRNSRG